MEANLDGVITSCSDRRFLDFPDPVLSVMNLFALVERDSVDKGGFKELWSKCGSGSVEEFSFLAILMLEFEYGTSII